MARACEFLMTSLKTRVFECSKNACLHVPDGEFFLTIGTWIGFFFLSLLRENYQILRIYL